MHSFRKPNQEAAFKLDKVRENKLLEMYTADIKRVEKLIQRDLSHWLVQK